MNYPKPIISTYTYLQAERLHKVESEGHVVVEKSIRMAKKKLRLLLGVK